MLGPVSNEEEDVGLGIGFVRALSLVSRKSAGLWRVPTPTPPAPTASG